MVRYDDAVGLVLITSLFKDGGGRSWGGGGEGEQGAGSVCDLAWCGASSLSPHSEPVTTSSLLNLSLASTRKAAFGPQRWCQIMEISQGLSAATQYM